MKVIVEKLTDVRLMRRAVAMTRRELETSEMTLAQIYKCEHSPMRTQMFWVEMLDIPTFVSVHFVRHKIGVEHFVASGREDLGGPDNSNRWSPVDHGMLLNAQALVNMARKRLCYKAHPETTRIMEAILDSLADIDIALARRLVPECIYRGGICNELKPCGYLDEGAV